MSQDVRCSTASAALDEPMAGTASTVASWLLLEHAGPWGVDAFVDARLPDGFGRELLERCAAARVRPLLIRRVGAGEAGGACFAMRMLHAACCLRPSPERSCTAKVAICAHSSIGLAPSARQMPSSRSIRRAMQIHGGPRRRR